MISMFFTLDEHCFLRGYVCILYPSSFHPLCSNWRKYANEEYENLVDDGGLLDEEDARNGSYDRVMVL